MADNATELQKLARGFQASAVLFALAELDLATALADFPSGISASSLAAHLNLQVRQLGALLDVAVAQGLLASNRQSDGVILYHNNALSATYLSRTGDFFIGNQLRSYHEQYAGWGNLAQAVRTGQNILPDLQNAATDRAALHRVLMGLHNSGKNILPKLLPLLDPVLNSARRILDVGSGTGVYSLAFAEKYPALQVVLLDKPEVLSLAQELAADSPALPRVTFRAENYLETDFTAPDSFDIILFFQVLRTESPETVIQLLTKAHQALTPGGRVLIYDTWLAENRITPLENVYQNLTMSMMYRQGGLFSAPELESWLAASGFDAPQIQLIEGIRPMALYSVRKETV
jgi:ubiquinone/menaquinone biosynthesis C-methylase UbiE